MKVTELEGYEVLATKEDLLMVRAEFHKSLAEFKAEIHKEFGDFKADLIKTIWITQLSTVGIILVGVGLLVHLVR